MASLFALDRELAQMVALIQTSVDEETGEIPEEMAEKLWAIEGSLKEKLLGWAKWFKNERGYAAMCREESKRLAERARTHERAMDWIKFQIGERLAKGEKLEDGVSRIGWRKSKAVVIDDAEAVPDSLCIVMRKPKLTEIRALLDTNTKTTGRLCTYAHIEERNGVSVS